MAPNLERATLPVPIFLRSSPDCLRSCFILTTLSPRKSRMWMFDVVSNVQRLPCSKESINKKYLLDYYETQLWFHYFKKVWCNSRNSNQSCKTDFALPESQRFRLLEWTWCVCVWGGGLHLPEKSNDVSCGHFLSSKSFSHASSIKQLILSLIKISSL